MAELARAACRERSLPDEHRHGRPGASRTSGGSTAAGSRRSWPNLLDNAERYGGGPVAVRLDAEDGAGVIEVDDDGPGRAAEDREAIFDRFVRGRAAHARAGTDGTGLGLALVAQHARGARRRRPPSLDRPGGGARFRVELPGAVR